MKLSSISQKLLEEVLRLKKEHSAKICSTPMLLSALYAVRGNEHDDFTNLFHIYFEKQLLISPSIIEKALEKGITEGKKKEDVSEQSKFEISINDKPLEFYVDAELNSIIEFVREFAEKHNRQEILPDYFTIALFETESVSLRKFLKEISANFMDAKNFFDEKKILGYEIVPYQISSFVSYRNPEAVGQKCDIVGRDDVINSVYRIMLKSSKRNVILYGESGVGKTAVGEKIIHEIANGICPKKFSNFKIFEMSVKDFIISCDNSNKANEMMNFLMEFLSKREDDIILLIDEIQTILGKGELFDTKKLDLSATLKPILTRGEVRIIGITTRKDYISSFTSDQTLIRRFEGVEVKEPKIKEVATMIAPKIKEMEEQKGVKIDSKLIETAIWYAACFEFYKNNPDKSIDVIDRAMANAEMEDRNYVTRQDIFEVFKISFKRWNGMSEQAKKNTAYHEAGHYVINRITNPGNIVILAVSIMPTEEYLGMNVLEYDEDVTPTCNRKYFIESIAADLAGRIAEELVSGEVNSGASDDLDSATEQAEAMITELGMSKGIARNRVYISDGMYGSDESAQEIDKEVNKIIDESYKVAEKLLKENRDLLDAVANALLEKQILMRSELEDIWNDTLNKRKMKNTSTTKPRPMIKVTVEGLPKKEEVIRTLNDVKKKIAKEVLKLRNNKKR